MTLSPIISRLSSFSFPRALHGLAARWLMAALVAVLPTLATAQSSKIAADLRSVLSASTTPTINWARDLNGVRYVKVLIVSNSTDPDLAALRSAVMSGGGAIYYRYTSVSALAAMLPASKVAGIAALAEVQSISPNRLMTRASSLLESVTGVGNVRATGGTMTNSTSGMTGNGIGIAVLDSGIAWQHKNFKGDGGESRVREPRRPP
jgi:serine protease AprX